MIRPVFYNDQDVLVEDLTQIITYQTDLLKTVVSSFLGSSLIIGGSYGNKTGVIGDPSTYTSSKDLKVSLYSGDPNIMFIQSGTAIDSSQNLIVVPSSLPLNKGLTTNVYSWLGNPGLNYVKLRYQEASGSFKTDLTGLLNPTRYTTGYFITIGNAVPLSNEIQLATFTADSNGTPFLSTLQDTRSYVGWRTLASEVKLNPNVAVKKTLPSHTTVEDHINAVGRGVVSQQNIHGLSLSDIGGDVALVNFIKHVNYSHLSGIAVLTPASSSAYNSFLGSVSGANLNFTPPTGAVAFINGSVIDSPLPSLTAAAAYAIGGDSYYFAVVNASGSTSWVKQSNTAIAEITSPFYRTNHTYPEYLILGLAQISGLGTSISSFTDYRGFYNLTALDIAATQETTLNPSLSLNVYSTLNDNLSRMRYQIARALGGVGTSWDTGTYVLTGGVSSNADSLHNHNFDNLGDVLNAFNTGDSNLRFTNLRKLFNGSNADVYHTHSNLSQFSLASGSIVYTLNSEVLNTTGKPIFISAIFSNSTSSDWDIFLSIKSPTNVWTNLGQVRVPAVSPSDYKTINGIVPTNFSYKIGYYISGPSTVYVNMVYG